MTFCIPRLQAIAAARAIAARLSGGAVQTSEQAPHLVTTPPGLPQHNAYPPPPTYNAITPQRPNPPPGYGSSASAYPDLSAGSGSYRGDHFNVQANTA